MSDEQKSAAPNWVQEQIEKIRETGTTEGLHVQGAPIVLLTMTGARSGQPRQTPVMRVEHDGQYAVVASKGGAPEHPAWYNNIVAHPDIKLQDGTQTREYHAREVEGDERAAWWERSVAAYPPYAEYQQKTDRHIPVFVLDPK